MDFQEWEPIYEQILADMGYDRTEDESSVRILKAVTLNSDLHSGDDFSHLVEGAVTVVGNAPCLEDDLDSLGIKGAALCSGSAVGRMLARGILPDMIFTDLDGEIEPQLEASSRGAVSFLHAHGDNPELIMRYAGLFTGPVVLTTQSAPEYTVFNYGGFTDGDRAYCYAKHFNSKEIRLIGFDYEHPMSKEGSDPSIKLRKLQWAKRIIESFDN